MVAISGGAQGVARHETISSGREERSGNANVGAVEEEGDG